ncbi:PP-loop family-domain-containing protein [Crucibulum laeve]|uniref:tRNA(Ile)-lysidine synthetase n=1 Tax=Crucibulum laeve TaxID=68775 RepID=A0A5C3MBS9_9AGAR|nr:PP-loop family-domain-containing protein [Crucibulum laeve]
MSSYPRRRILPISRDEFSRLLQRTIPPPGWLRNLGVANSGGADSTCLLFLLHRFLRDSASTEFTSPRVIMSMTVDHDLQPTSSAMAAHCARVADRLGIEHLTTKITWGEGKYPPRPEPGQSMENIARSARYRALFEVMKRSRVDILALGHHADDQVETSLMRLGRGSTEYGAGGMRPIRRWGMGMGREGDTGYFGYEGMNKWMIRPLLSVSKERILATCETNKLEFVTDETNFQPALTLRNAIRHVLNPDPNKQSMPELPPDIAEKLEQTNKAVSSLESVVVNIQSGPDQLRGAVQLLNNQVRDTDEQVDYALKRCIHPSPNGTLILLSRHLAAFKDPLLQVAMVIRIIRYISFYPWGSTRGDALRRSDSLKLIVKTLWQANPLISRSGSFTAGGGVLWTPVLVRGHRIRTPDPRHAVPAQADEQPGWIVSRMPQPRAEKMRQMGITVDPLHRDVTPLFKDVFEKRRQGQVHKTLRVLYDNRYLVQFDLERIPMDLLMTFSDSASQEKILLLPNSRWFYPKVVRTRTNGKHETIQTKLEPIDEQLSLSLPPWKVSENGIASDWITIKWIRTLEAI